MEQRIKQLCTRLNFLGYCTFEIKIMLREAIGSAKFNIDDDSVCTTVISVLEKYERLGVEYMQSYSK
ncbi:MAG: hypothetical protein N2491_04990 [Negativicutes bacterium]|nr:hypothetical protein [Negativicutes bacterium]